MALWFGFPDKRTGFGAVGSGLCFAAERGIDRPGGFLSFPFVGRASERGYGDRVFDNWIWRKRSVDGGVSGGRSVSCAVERLRRSTFRCHGFWPGGLFREGRLIWLGLVTSSMRDQMPDKVLIPPESLILAQNERWRQA